jgi:RNA polymerase sigma-70 factor (ECF subfamily)
VKAGVELSVVDDATLVLLARTGDHAAFEALLGRYKNRVFLMALGILGSFADAEDVAQEVSVTAWRQLASITDPAAVRTWLFRVAHRQCLGVLRTRRTQELTNEIPDRPDPASDPHRSTESRHATHELNTALAKLTTPQRHTWLLFEIHGLPHLEIARLSGGTEDAVRRRLARARAHLAHTMRAWH